MGRKLTASAGGDDKPSVHITAKAGITFTGRLSEFKKEIKETKLGSSKFLYEFAIMDGDAPVSRKSGNGYVDVDVDPGDIVTLFASGILHKMLQQVEPGEIVKITYLGKVKSKKGFVDKNFDAEVLDEPAGKVPFNS